MVVLKPSHFPCWHDYPEGRLFQAISSKNSNPASVSASQTARTQRGWTLEVLNIVRQLCEVGTADPAVRAPDRREIPAALPPVTPHRGVPTNTFTTSDVYAFEQELEQLHPGNRNIKAKIRQQLQELRDQNLLLHIDRNFVSSVNFCREDFVPFVVFGGFLSGFIRVYPWLEISAP